jgi:exportin-1
MTESMESALQRICDLSQEMDVPLLDKIVNMAYDPVNPQRSSANKILMTLKENPDIWVRADAIMERAMNVQTRFLGLQLLEDVIRIRYAHRQHETKFFACHLLRSQLDFAIIDGKSCQRSNVRG